MIRYFISYSHQDAGGFGTGNVEVSLPRPIRSMDDVTVVTDLLRRNGIGNPLVLSFCRFEPEADTTEASNRPGPADGLTFDYIHQLLQEQNRPLSANDIARLLNFPIDAVHRVLRRAVQLGHLATTNNRYTLPKPKARP